MLLKQAELFRGLSHDLMEKVMADASRETHPAGTILFEAGDRADRFYTLLKGTVKLTIGEEGRMVFSVSRAGESFGWSSLLSRETYSATARCTELTTVVGMGRKQFLDALGESPIDGYRLMKHLAEMLGQRLIYSYRTILSYQSAHAAPTDGTGQRLEQEAAV